MPDTNAANFTQGNAGEKYIRRHIQQLLAHGFVTGMHDTETDFVEGGDKRIIYNRLGDAVEIPEYVRVTEPTLSSTGQVIVATLVGGLEVKTISNFTFRDNDLNEPSGTIPFELWRDDEHTQPGWLPALLYPEIRIEQTEGGQRLHAVQPVLLAYLLVSYIGPYACVMFEDFAALKQRLHELAAEYGLRFTPNGIQQENTEQLQNNACIIGRMLHIPFSRLSDIATVTMIGEQPLTKLNIQLHATGNQYEDLQEQRYAYLHRCAGDRFITAEVQSRLDFYPDDESHIFADVLENIEIIEHLNQEQYPYLFQALKNRFMRVHFKYILLNMYSHPYQTVLPNRMICFLQATKYLHGWCKEHRVPGSPFSWQSHLVFLTDAELLKKFVDVNQPIDRQVYRSIPRYTDDVLQFANLKAKAYLEAGIKLNNFTKSEVIKVSGQERANHLYFGDDRIISHMESVVDDVFIAEANRIIDTFGYAIPDEVAECTWSILNVRYWIDIFDESPDSERVRKRKQASQQVKRLVNRYDELSKRIPCDYRTLSKDEKETFDFSIHSKRKVYIRQQQTETNSNT